MTSPAAALLIAPIRFYQRFITPYTPGDLPLLPDLQRLRASPRCGPMVR